MHVSAIDNVLEGLGIVGIVPSYPADWKEYPRLDWNTEFIL
jgi:hypothetical protein